MAGTLTGFEFGSRKTKTICARIYDKTADVGAKGSSWWYEVWGGRSVEGLPVHGSVELGARAWSIRIDTPLEALEAMGDLELRHRGMAHLPLRQCRPDPFPLASGSRVAIRAGATLRHRAVGLARLHESRRRTSIARLMPGLNGYLVSMAALLDSEGIDDTLVAVRHHLHTYKIVSHVPRRSVHRHRAELEHR